MVSDAAKIRHHPAGKRFVMFIFHYWKISDKVKEMHHDRMSTENCGVGWIPAAESGQAGYKTPRRWVPGKHPRRSSIPAPTQPISINCAMETFCAFGFPAPGKAI